MTRLTLIFIFLLSVGCGGGKDNDKSASSGSGSGPGSIDSLAPTALINFPPPISLTEGNSIIVRGTASDNLSEITQIRVNGIEATSSDNFANWQADIPLNAGENLITVETSDIALNSSTNAAQVGITRSALLIEPWKVAVDTANNRALVVDRTLDIVVEVDLTTGNRDILSTSTDSETSFTRPEGMAIDALNNRLLVVDSAQDAVIAVELNDGKRTILSNDKTPANGDNPFSRPTDIQVDLSNNRALVLDDDLNAILAVNLTSGERSIISDASTAGDLFSSPTGMVLDSRNNRLLVVDKRLNALIEVNLDTGVRSILSDSTRPNSNNNLVTPESIDIDNDNNRVLVVDSGGSGQILSISLTDGERSILSSATIPDSDNILDTPKDGKLDKLGNRLLVVDLALDFLFEIDLDTGERSVFSAAVTPNANNRAESPVDIIHDTEKNRLLALYRSGLFGATILDIDLVTGERVIFHDEETPPNPSAIISEPEDMALDLANNRLLVSDTNMEAIFTVQLDTGESDILSDNSTPNANNSIDDAIGITLDVLNDRALVLDEGNRSLLAIDLTDGSRSVISDDIDANTTSTSNYPEDIIIDSVNDRALITRYDNSLSLGAGSLIAIDFASGLQAILSDNGIPDNSSLLEAPIAIEIDIDDNRAVIVDANRLALTAINLASGERSILSDANTPNAINRFLEPVEITLDSEQNLAYVIDVDLGVVAVDLVTGQRVIQSR